MSDIKDLSEQLAKLRRSNRILLILVIVGPLFALGTSLGLSRLPGRAEAEIEALRYQIAEGIETQRLVIRDRSGLVRAVLDHEDKDSVGLKLYSREKERSRYGIGLNGVPVTSYFYSDGSAACEVVGGGSSPEHAASPSITFYDEGGQRMFLGLGDSSRNPFFTMSSKHHAIRFESTVNDEGQVITNTYNDKGEKIER